jgi:hypothetical protein
MSVASIGNNSGPSAHSGRRPNPKAVVSAMPTKARARITGIIAVPLYQLCTYCQNRATRSVTAITFWAFRRCLLQRRYRRMRREGLRCLFKTQETNGGLVVLKTLAKLIFGVAALAAATSFGTSTSRAYGDTPWCAVINIGQGTVYWDCQYPTFEACYHLGNIVAAIAAFAI